MNLKSTKNRLMRNPRLRPILDFAQECWSEWNDDKVAQLASNLTYYAIFSLSPLLIIGMAFISFFFEKQTAQAQLLAQVQSVIDKNSTELIASMLTNASSGNNGIVATLISFAALLFSLTSATKQEIIDSLYFSSGNPCKFYLLNRISGGGQDLREVAAMHIGCSDAMAPPPGGRIDAYPLNSG